MLTHINLRDVFTNLRTLATKGMLENPEHIVAKEMIKVLMDIGALRASKIQPVQVGKLCQNEDRFTKFALFSRSTRLSANAIANSRFLNLKNPNQNSLPPFPSLSATKSRPHSSIYSCQV